MQGKKYEWGIIMKKIIALALGAIMTAGLLAGCGASKNQGEDQSSLAVQSSAQEASSESTAEGGEKKLSIVTTIFPSYDWVRQVLGKDASQVELSVLNNNGVDLHSYSPSVEDVARISDADLFIYVGGESDTWVDGILQENPNLNTVNLLETIGSGALEEELVEGMQPEEHEHEAGQEEEEGPEYDEHVWLSLNNAQILVKAISDKIVALDPEHKADYEKNTQDYLEQLAALDEEYASAIGGSDQKALIFCDRFPFRYMVQDYGLKYYAAFAGCSAETEASFDTVAFLAGKIDELGVKDVLKIDGSDGKLAQSIVDSTQGKNAHVLTLNSMQSTTTKDNTTYLEVMRQNLEVLKEALK